MSLQIFHTDHLDISNHLDFPSELLNSPGSNENYILVVGPDLVKREAAPDQRQTYTYLERLLEGMVEWCTQKKVIQEQNIVNDLHTLLHNGALVPLGYRIEEYLAVRQLKQQCLKTVLFPHNQVRKIHCNLACFAHSQYITTGYDTCIETAYAETWHSKLSKFYLSSLAQAVDASRKKQPFILKLYGDLDEPNSIKLGHRLLTGLYAEDVREQLRQLFSETPAIFIGFDDADGDLDVLQSLVKDGYIVHQKHPTRVTERLDGIITKPDDQSSSDYIAYELSPEKHPPGLVISPHNGDVDFKEEKLFPNIKVPELIGATTFKAIAKDSKESNDSKDSKKRHQNAGAIPLSSRSSFPSPNDVSDGNRQSLPDSQSGALENIRVSRDTFKDFFSLLEELDYKPVEKTVTRLGAWCYESVEVHRNEKWDLIYLPDEILTKPTQTNLLIIGGLCLVLGRGAFVLIFHTAGEKLDIQIKQIITLDWLKTADVTAHLVSLEEIKQIMKTDVDTRLDLAKRLFVR